MIFLGYPKCSTSQKARNWLDTNGITYTYRDIVKDHPNEKELTEWYAKSGLQLKTFFNTSGLVYKDLNLKDKLPSLSEHEQIKLLSTNGKLVKRPILLGKDFVLVGFKEAFWKTVLG